MFPGRTELERQRAENATLVAQNAELAEEASSLKEEVTKVKHSLGKESERVRELWKTNCAQVASFDTAITAKDNEIESLRARVAELEAAAGSVSTIATPTAHSPTDSRLRLAPPVPPSARIAHTTRRGKAPPVNEFSGEDPECLLEDWLPSFERASLWNAWSEEEQMIQLAGHLKGRALQEWNLLSSDQRATYARATEALRSRLDSISKTVAAQDFRHATQREGESVSDFIRRLERTFRSAYGRDLMSTETRETPVWPTARRPTTPTNARTGSVWSEELPGVVCCGKKRRKASC